MPNSKGRRDGQMEGQENRRMRESRDADGRRRKGMYREMREEEEKCDVT